MGIVITVDLAASSPAEIARAAKFMLEFAGYQDPSVTQQAHDEAADRADRPSGAPAPLAHHSGSPGEEIHDTATIEPTTSYKPGEPLSAVDAALPPPPPGIEVDAQGVPWDVRIHAGSRAKVADGTWRQKRNLDPEVYKQVMDELRHTMGVERRAPQPPAPPAPQQVFAPHPPVPPVPPVPVFEVDRETEVVAQVPPVPFAGSAVPPAPPTSGTPPVPASAGAATGASRGSTPTFPDLMKRITAGFAGGTIKQPDIQRAVQKVGLPALPMLASRPDLVGDVATELGIAL